MKVILPSEELIAVPDEVLMISELRQYIEARTGIPAVNQCFCVENVQLNEAADLAQYQDADIDLVIQVGTSFSICREGLKSRCLSGNDEILISNASKIKSRNITTVRAETLGNFALQRIEQMPKQEAAKPYMDAFFEDRENRLDEIRRICRKLHQNPIVISTFNWGYREMLANWVASCDRNSIDCRAFSLIFPTDPDAEKFAMDLGLKTFFHNGAYGMLPKDAAEIFGDMKFRRMMFAKIAMTKDMLDAGFDIVRQDVDMVWHQDPRYELAKQAHQCGNDMLFMYDGENKEYWPLNYNSGFIYISNNEFTRYAWQLILQNYGRVLTDGGEQRLINTIMLYLTARGLSTERLEENRFVNGHLISRAIHQDGNLPDGSAVVHASWTSDIKPKITHMKRFGLWFI